MKTQLKMLKRLIMLVLLLVTNTANAASIISKAEVDYIFGIDQSQYELYIRGIVPPGYWKLQFNRLNTGSKLFAFNPDLGFAMLLSPVFENEKQPPKKIIVGSYFHDNRIPQNMDSIMGGIHQKILEELGNDYSLTVRKIRAVPLVGIEIDIIKN